MVKRYAMHATHDNDCEPGEDAIGYWVAFPDYEKLEQENARLREALDNLRNLYTCTADNTHGCQGHRIYNLIDKALAAVEESK